MSEPKPLTPEPTNPMNEAVETAMAACMRWRASRPILMRDIEPCADQAFTVGYFYGQEAERAARAHPPADSTVAECARKAGTELEYMHNRNIEALVPAPSEGEIAHVISEHFAPAFAAKDAEIVASQKECGVLTSRLADAEQRFREYEHIVMTGRNEQHERMQARIAALESQLHERAPERKLDGAK